MMKARVYRGAHEVRLEEVDEPIIPATMDAIVRGTGDAIGGADL